MGEVKLLARLLKWLDDLSPGLLGRLGGLKSAVEIGGGLLLGGLTVLLLIAFVVKFGVRIFGQFVKHDTFPAVVSTVIFVVSTVSSFVTLGPWGSLGGLSAGIVGAMTAHEKMVKIHDNAQKKDLPADTPTEAPPPTDVGGSAQVI